MGYVSSLNNLTTVSIFVAIKIWLNLVYTANVELYKSNKSQSPGLLVVHLFFQLQTCRCPKRFVQMWSIAFRFENCLENEIFDRNTSNWQTKKKNIDIYDRWFSPFFQIWHNFRGGVMKWSTGGDPKGLVSHKSHIGMALFPGINRRWIFLKNRPQVEGEKWILDMFGPKYDRRPWCKNTPLKWHESNSRNGAST